MSIDSVMVAGSGIIGLSLPQLCDSISQHRSLQQAEIVCSEGYAVRAGAVIHRFLVLQLRRARRKMIWLRLDRLRSTKVSPLGFLRAGASTPANDTVCSWLLIRARHHVYTIIDTLSRQAQLSARKEELIGSARLETRQVFKTTPTLGDLRYMFQVICDELQRYELWPVCTLTTSV